MKITLPTNIKAVLDINVIVDGNEIEVLYRMRPGAENIDDEMVDEAAAFCLQFIKSNFSFSKFAFVSAVIVAIRKFKIKIGRRVRLAGTSNEIINRRRRDINSHQEYEERSSN